ncbi:MAG TPA: HEAT repeat domain-containing protein, partial [Planctomycetota bacterium]|nr:HEAT repeat domain-containing protein [Planctomycetota bacterium]
VPVQADWQHGFADVTGLQEMPAAGEDPMSRFWDEKLGDLDVAAVLQRLQAFLDSKREPSREYHELLQMLAQLVRRDPGEADRLAGLVQSARLTGQAAADVLAVLGMAGNERAQVALAAVFENGLVEAGLRRAAVESMFQLEHPSQALVDSLRRSLHGVGRLDVLAGSSMLALGALGTRGAVTAEGGALVDELLGLEAAARQDGLEGAWSEALGNTGDPAVVPLAQRLSASNDPVERARAVTVLRRVTSPAAAALLQSIARGDPDADVRRLAVQTIGESTAAWTRDVLVDRAATDGDAEVRRVAYSALASRARTDTVAHSALVQRLGNEPDPELRQMLQSLLRGA